MTHGAAFARGWPRFSTPCTPSIPHTSAKARAAAVRARRCAAGHRRSRAGHARCQCKRPSVHGRLRRYSSLRRPAQVRLRVAARVDRARRRPLDLRGCRITNAVKCLPPGNKPTPVEVRACNGYLAADLATVPAGGAILALGRIAHEAALRALARKPSAFAFAHGAQHALDRGIALFDSYHCSRYNTNTGRLTEAMFHAVFAAIARHFECAAAGVPGAN